jgi:hypothetical protein
VYFSQTVKEALATLDRLQRNRRCCVKACIYLWQFTLNGRGIPWLENPARAATEANVQTVRMIRQLTTTYLLISFS